jgi:cyclomaltodextrinase
VMNYNFAFASADYFVSDETRISTSEFDRRLRELREAFPPGVAEVQQNLFSSHDTNRIGSHIVNRDRESWNNWGKYFEFSKAHKGRYDTRKPTDSELDVQKLFAVFQMTYVGAPMIYYGDEVGMWGANDPCCRKPMVWDDFVYDDEVYGPDGQRRAHVDRVSVNRELLEHYRRLIQLRNELPALRRGTFETVLLDDERQLYGFRRSLDGQEVVVVLNNSTDEQQATLALDGAWVDRWNETDLTADQESIDLALPPRGAAILVKES